MYILHGKTYDWITPVKSINDILLSVKNPAKKICVVELAGLESSYFDIWSCSSDKDAMYDLQRFYKFNYQMDFDDMNYYFCKIKPFSSRPVIVYHRLGRKYRKLERNEVIKEGAMHSWCGGELSPIMNDGTVGQTPNDFSNERDFYNPINRVFL